MAPPGLGARSLPRLVLALAVAGHLAAAQHDTADAKPRKATTTPFPTGGDQGAPSRADAGVEKSWLRRHPFEAVLCFGLAGTVVTWFFGSRRNKQIATMWEEACIDVYHQNFASIDVTQVNANLYKVTAEGKGHITSCVTHLDLFQRQNMLSTYMFVMMVMASSDDMCTVEIALDAMDTLSLCVCQKKELKALESNRKDLAHFTKPRKVEELEKTSLCVVSDSAEAAALLLKPAVLKALTENEECVHSLHISDIMGGRPGQKVIRAYYKMPTKADKMEKVANLLQMTFQLVDAVATAKVSERAKKSVAEARKEVTKAMEAQKRLEQERAVQQRKLDKKKQEEAAAEKLGPEAQRKLEEKEYKKSLKARGPKMKMQK